MLLKFINAIRLYFKRDKFYNKPLVLNFENVQLNNFDLLYQNGHKIIYGEFNILGKQVLFSSFYGLNNRGNVITFNVNYLNNFNWLQHLKALNTIEAAERAASFLESWCIENRNTNFSQEDFNILADRIFYWFVCGKFFLRSESIRALKIVMQSLNLQCNCFLSVYKNHVRNKSDEMNISIAKALLAIGLSTNNYSYINHALDIVFENTKQGILADGGAINRNPSSTLKYLEDLLYIYYLLKDKEVLHRKLTKLRQLIDNITIFIKSIRGAEGVLAVFNGGFEGDKFKIDFILSLSNLSANTIIDLKPSGYLNVLGRNCRIIFDTGAPLPDYNGILSNEISIGKSKIVTNNGPYQSVYNFDSSNAKSRLDHSTLILENHKGEILFMPFKDSDLQISKRTEDIWEIVNFTYSGLRQKYGLIYHKRVFLSLLNKEYIVGEEMLSFAGPNTKIAKAYLRFNLTPWVKNLELLKSNSLAVFTVNDVKYCVDSKQGAIEISKVFYKGIQGQSLRSAALNLPFNLNQKTVNLNWLIYPVEFKKEMKLA